ncbi:MAG: hypothetical protein RL637_348 [Pseudomonadota bacterium]|jgi:uncharacterized protein (TIGR00645 family)
MKRLLSFIEFGLERSMYASRWFMAPVYLGMSLTLLAIGVKFFQELSSIIVRIIVMKEAELVLRILDLIDLTLVGSLVVMVMFSGYENFVSQLDITEETERLGWLGTHDYNSLKMKVATSIVAISSIHLLKIFMNVDQIANDKVVLYITIHMIFVISALLLAYLGRIEKH